MAEIRDIRPLNRQSPQGEARTAIAQNAKIHPSSAIKPQVFSEKPPAVLNLEERRRQYREKQAEAARVAGVKDLVAEVSGTAADVRRQAAETKQIAADTIAANEATRQRRAPESISFPEPKRVVPSAELPRVQESVASVNPPPEEPVNTSFGARLKNGLRSLQQRFFPPKAA